MERVAQGDMSYFARKECPIRKQCKRAIEFYDSSPEIVCMFYPDTGICDRYPSPENCRYFIKVEE
jgi:hypothetical protein